MALPQGDFVKSSYSSAGGACVEAGVFSGEVRVRDSKVFATGPVLALSPEVWEGFVASALELSEAIKV